MVDPERLGSFFARMNLRSSDPATSLSRFFADLKRLDFGSGKRTALEETARINPSSARTLFDALSHHRHSLKRASRTINIWRVAGLGRDEVRNAAALGWVLDARQSHGCGAGVLNALLGDLQRRQPDSFPIPVSIAGSYTIVRESYIFGDVRNRVDLLIDTTDSVIIIEVKIGAGERIDQVRDYLRLAHERAIKLDKPHSCVLYLTPGRIYPSIRSPHLVLCSWKDISRSILLTVSRVGCSDFDAQALTQLASHFDQLKS